MRLGSASLHGISNFVLVMVLLGLPSAILAREPAPSSSGKVLTIERIYSLPSLSVSMTRGLTWTPDGKQLSYFETKGSGHATKTQLLVMDASNGSRRLLVAS